MMNAIATFLAIGAGGAIGAMSRHGVNILSVKIMGHGFPYGTLSVNLIGSFLMGVLVIIFATLWQPPEALRVLIITGFLGAFTTFSTFSLDFVTLIERHNYIAGGSYLAASVILSIAALFAGMTLMRAFIS